MLGVTIESRDRSILSCDCSGSGTDEEEPLTTNPEISNPNRMTIAQIKQWLIKKDLTGVVWDMGKQKAKRADWVAKMRSVQNLV